MRPAGHGSSRSADAVNGSPKRSGRRGDHDGALRRRRFAIGFEASHARGFLVVEPGLRQEDREQSEQDRKADHDEGTGTQVRPLMTPETSVARKSR